jgi:hypothetical protein
MKKVVTTLAVLSVALSSAVALAAPPRPEPNYCHRIRNAIATGTPISALPARLVRECFGNHPPVRVQPARPQADADPVAAPVTRGR